MADCGRATLGLATGVNWKSDGQAEMKSPPPGAHGLRVQTAPAPGSIPQRAGRDKCQEEPSSNRRGPSPVPPWSGDMAPSGPGAGGRCTSGGKTIVSRGWEAKVGVGMVSSGVRYMGGLLRALGLWPFVKAFLQHPFNRKSLLCARRMLF